MKKSNREFWRSFRTQGIILVVRNGTVAVGRILDIVAAVIVQNKQETSP